MTSLVCGVPLTALLWLLLMVICLTRSTTDAFVLSSPKRSSFSTSRRSLASLTLSANQNPVEGQVVTIDLDLEPEGDFVPEPLFDQHGVISFVLGRGNYLPGLHDLVSGMTVGEQVENVSLDAGWGSRNPQLVASLKLADLSATLDTSQLSVGTKLQLANGMMAVVSELTDETVTIDANPSLAGASYLATVELQSVEDGPTQWNYNQNNPTEEKYQVATFALGCFWGGELDFMRQPGVVGTAVGYTQGTVENPSYQQVCSGTTGHTEAIQVVYDSTKTTYETLCQLPWIAWEKISTLKIKWAMM